MAWSVGILEVIGMVWVIAALALLCGDDACSLKTAASWPVAG
jgi:hypothetical protein